MAARLLGLMMLVLCLAVAPVPSRSGELVTSLASGRVGEFTFTTRNVTGFPEMAAGEKKYNAVTLGRLVLPPAAGPENKVPVMVILHGSGGEWSGRGRDMADFLAAHGVGGLVVDTFGGRGLTKKDEYISRLMEVNFPDQLTDAFAALELLQTHPAVDGTRIGLMGFSMGGVSAVLASFEQIAAWAASGKRRFALHVAFYAPGVIFPEQEAGTGAAVVCLWGRRDESTPLLHCRDMMEHLDRGGTPVQAFWYPGAAHGWNGRKAMKYYKGFPNFAGCRWTIGPDGVIREGKTDLIAATDRELIANSERCVSFGYTIGRHSETDAKAKEDLLRVIREFMPAGPGPEKPRTVLTQVRR